MIKNSSSNKTKQNDKQKINNSNTYLLTSKLAYSKGKETWFSSFQFSLHLSFVPLFWIFSEWLCCLSSPFSFFSLMMHGMLLYHSFTLFNLVLPRGLLLLRGMLYQVNLPFQLKRIQGVYKPRELSDFK